MHFITFLCLNSFSFWLDMSKEITTIVAMYIIKNEERFKNSTNPYTVGNINEGSFLFW